MKKVFVSCIRKTGILLIAALLLTACRPSSAPREADKPAAEPRQTDPVRSQQTTAVPKTPSPTPEPTVVPISEEALNAGALDAFFDGALLVGDSLTAGFSNYVIGKRATEGACLGTMKCIGQSALFLEKAYLIEIGKRAPVLRYRGREYSISDLVCATEAKTLYLLLGVNDIYNNPVEDDLSFYREIIDRTREKSPDVRIVIVTVPPVLESYAEMFGYEPGFNEELNEALRVFCEENGYGLAELAERVRGENGWLLPALCRDDKFHLNNDGRALWLAALREYAKTQYESGAWTPEETPAP